MRKWVNKVNLLRFSTQNLFQIRACVISGPKAKHFDVTNMFTYSHANTPLGQSECAYYLSYFINTLNHFLSAEINALGHAKFMIHIEHGVFSSSNAQ